VRVTINFANYDSGSAGYLCIDFDEMTLEFKADFEVEESFADLDGLNAAYQKTIAPYFRENDCFDIETNQEVTPVANLASYKAELAASDTGEEMPSSATPVTRATIEFANRLRRLLNHAVGPDPFTLNHAVFSLGDEGINAVLLNPPVLAGTSDSSMREVIAAHPYGAWTTGGEVSERGLEMHAFPKAFDEFGEIDNLYGDLFSRLMYLACARIEAAPYLRSNVTASSSLRVFFLFHDDADNPSWERRKLAARFVNRSADDYYAS
jgi:hypothetical protein